MVKSIERFSPCRLPSQCHERLHVVGNTLYHDLWDGTEQNNSILSMYTLTKHSQVSNICKAIFAYT